MTSVPQEPSTTRSRRRTALITIGVAVALVLFVVLHLVGILPPG